MAAHVRASTAGSLSQDNCHPWNFGRLMWMHNGGIADIAKFKRRLQARLTDELYNFPQGNTDSEWAFALYLSMLSDPHASTFDQHELRGAMLKTISTLNDWARHCDITEPSLMNFCVTDGHTVVATRYISSKKDEAASLYFSSGTTFDEYAPGGHYRMSKCDKRENIIMIASEPLTFEAADWMEIPTNTLIVVTPKPTLQMNLLQIPIVDEFHLSDPLEAKKRGSDFAVQKGFLGSAFGPRRGKVTASGTQSPAHMSEDVKEEGEDDDDHDVGEDEERLEAREVPPV
ncbi:hypothetical protein FRB98_006031 [Tulasnella sp. 332]|nr:hypothetical protein FRB98_006031 [Tulasnella sp. 332]